MNKLLSILLLLPLSCLSQKIEFSTGNGILCGIQRPIGWPYLVIKGMYAPNNKLQLGASGFIGPYRSADIFMNVWPGGPSLTRTRFYVGINT
ncbi:MAG TPA: hypothetical protein VEB40_03875, partial [Flavipsychrobacter sp.]|nr:hypothetical protein [Flavipsychrobacter sp.]